MSLFGTLFGRKETFDLTLENRAGYDGRFRVDVPAAWPYSSSQALLCAKEPQGRGIFEVWDLIPQNPITLERMAEISEGGLKAQYPGARRLAVEDVPLASARPCRLVRMGWVEHGEDIVISHYLLPHGGIFYSLNFHALKAVHDAYADTFRAVVDSFRPAR